MSDSDRSVMVPPGANDDTHPRIPAYVDLTNAEESTAAEPATSLVGLGFITAALRRRAWLWCATAMAGLLIGLGIFAEFPALPQASTSVFLTPPPGDNPNDSILTDVALAQTQTVAGLAVRKLGLRQSASSFLGSYTVTELTDEVLLITASAPTSSQAVSRASAVAAVFLQFRADQQEAALNLTLKSLDQQISEAKRHVGAIAAQIRQVSAQPVSTANQAKLKSLQAQRTKATTALGALEQTTVGNQAATQAATTATIKGSWVLDAATPIVPHVRKRLVIYAGVGLFGGLVLGLAIVVLSAVISERLRRRDDVAHALGASVGLSVGAMKASRWRPGGRRRAAARGRDMRRIVEHLRHAVPKRSALRGATLAVVAVDNAQVAAPPLVSLATSWAGGGEHVVVADLSDGAHAARRLGVKHPGIHAVSVKGTHLVVVLPDRGADVPIGPLPSTAGPEPDGKLAAAFAKADLLLTLGTLDPAVGGEHLATWATDAVVMVTAGRSSWTKINAVGEMIRLAGVRLVSAVLVGADKTDESLGVAPPPGARREAEVMEGLVSP